MTRGIERSSNQPSMASTQSCWLQAAIILLFALTTRLVYLFVFQPDVDAWPDSRHVDEIAQRLASGGSYDADHESPPAIYRSPFVPYVVAGVYAVLGYRPEIAQLLIAASGACAVAIIYVVTRMLFSPLSAVLASVGAAVYPLFIAVSGTYYPESMGILLMVALFTAFVRLSTASKVGLGSGVLIGVLAGVCALCRPNWLLSAPLAIPLVWLARRQRGLRTPFVFVVAGGITWCAAWAPWAIRNYFAYDAVIPITASGGRNFWLGNVPDASGSSKTDVFVPQHVSKREYELRQEPKALQGYFYKLGMEHVRSDPARAAELWVAKMLHMWSPVPEVRTRSLSLLEKLTIAVPTAALFVLAPFGFVVAARRGHGWVGLFLLIVVVDTAIVSIFIAPQRLRIGFDAVLFVFAGVALSAIVERLRDNGCIPYVSPR